MPPPRSGPEAAGNAHIENKQDPNAIQAGERGSDRWELDLTQLEQLRRDEFALPEDLELI